MSVDILNTTRGLKQTLARLRPLFVGTRSRVAVLATSSVLAGFVEAAILVLIVQVALAISHQDDAASLSLGPLGTIELTLVQLLVTALILAIIRFGLQVSAAYLGPRISADVLVRMRKELITSFLAASWTTQSKEREGHLQDLMMSQVSSIARAVLTLTVGLVAFCNFTALLTSAFIVELWAAGAIIVVVTGLFFVIRPISGRSRAQSAALSAAGLDVAQAVNETVRVSEQVHVYNVETPLRAELEKGIEDTAKPYFRTKLLSQLVPAVYQSLALACIVLALLLLYFVGSQHLVSLGSVVLILIRALTYSQAIQQSYHELNDIVPFAERVQSTTEAWKRDAVSMVGAPLEHIDRLEFRNVSYEYRPGTKVLNGVSFAVPSGGAIGIVGPSGAGKSTLVQILLGLRSPLEGSYMVNGADLGSLSRTDWFSRIAFVPQEPVLIEGTVIENIAFYRDLDRATCEWAAQQAHIAEEIAGWRDGFDTTIGQRVDAISGGQRQRICLARALAGKPDVLVLDEPTSSLDMQSEALVQETLAQLRGQVTLFVIAHRLSTLNVCDRIMVLEHGQLVGFEGAAALKETNQFFRRAVELSRLP